MKIICISVGMLETNCYLVYDEDTKEGVIIDPGADAERILEQVTTNGVDVKAIFLTHGHFDHILAASDVQDQTGAPVILHENDTFLIEKDMVEAYKSFLAGKYKECHDVRPVADGFSFSFGGLKATWMHTPGHSPGSSVIQIGQNLFTGDTLFQREIGRTDLVQGDYGAILLSLKRLYELDGDYRVYPGHGGFSTLEEERRENRYMHLATKR